MTNKYEIIKDTKRKWRDSTLYRIRATRSFGPVAKGDFGGWIACEENLSQDGDSWVGNNAIVCDNARVSCNAKVYGRAIVAGDAQVHGDAEIYGCAVINGFAIIYEKARVYGDAEVSGSAEVHGNAKVHGNAELCSGMTVYGNIDLTD